MPSVTLIDSLYANSRAFALGQPILKESAVNGNGKTGLSDSVSVGSFADLTAAPFTTTAALIRHLCSEALLLFRLAFKLWSYLGVGWKWTINLYRLIIYAMLLMPGFIQMIVFYFSSKRVHRSVLYGRKPRQRLDLYFPPSMHSTSAYPVVIYVTGGAWTIGYKAWGALLARRMSKQGVVVACLDYRNFPQGNAAQMLEDVNTGIAWVCDRIHKYHGDPENITLVGQSAGGHLSALAVLRQAEQALTGKSVSGAFPSWSPKDIRAFVGVSGAYDLEGLSEHLHRRGLYRDMFAKIMSLDGKPALEELSPLSVARSLPPGVDKLLPEVTLIHGTRDQSVPHECSLQLNEALRALNVSSNCRLIEGKGHTSFLIEGPMCGGRDLLMDSILYVVSGQETTQIYSTMCPNFLCTLAGWVCPF